MPLRLTRFSLTSADAGRLAGFYVAAFGCRATGRDRLDGPAFERLMGVACGAARATVSLGGETIECLEFDRAGCSYPAGGASSDLLFQHFAIVVADMAAAYQQLASVPGWTPISRGGPVLLPPSSGGVTAFKFRDPEGHPLELLAYPPAATPRHWQAAAGSGRLWLGIDHSALSVSDTARSIAFYQGLGCRVAGGSRNQGAEQALLDGLDTPEVAVTALAPGAAPPHIELLCYRAPAPRAPIVLASNDIAATRLVLEPDPQDEHERAPAILILDPDGHQLAIGDDPVA